MHYAQAVCSEVGAMVNMSDFAIRPAFAMKNGDVLQTGKRRYYFIKTPYLPHGWDAGVMFEETNKTLLCSDLLHQSGDLPAITDKDILKIQRVSVLQYLAGPLMDYSPHHDNANKILYELAALEPNTLATMHGSSFFANCRQVLQNLDEVMKEVLGGSARQLLNCTWWEKYK